MADVVIYDSEHCAFCIQAKKLLDKKEIEYKEIRVDLDDKKRDEMLALSGRKTVPQIFINGTHIGGCDDLYALEKAGKLESMLTVTNI